MPAVAVLVAKMELGRGGAGLTVKPDAHWLMRSHRSLGNRPLRILETASIYFTVCAFCRRVS